ncbi:hypothetical protein IWW57_002046 [Coemansia sp. S610]|uniref:Uncharacterized protein n=1 Tax=Coemansia spiralis TaxID=417178 RepID=A0A9W8L1E2_9FUNG|nr:hypothetical protein IWW57_002046 [Coemansia sp. S610]KAJ2413182.1 hypothetical protein GGI10_003217 [Coemansia sp. RSA 2530]KAJ2684753.1 hypothetical protein IWW39_004726 [Coemansia spiralis]KAJ2701327.1 hypothetical protein H4218_001487 [Coemansia sp. IMI 209128]
MSAAVQMRISGTGAGTGFKAATDIDKENGLVEAGGYPLVSDWNDPKYIGHGVGHRDPKTGDPIPANVHIPSDGELNPQNYLNVAAVEEDPQAARQRIRDAFLLKYDKKKASLYRANMYSAIGGIQSKVGRRDAGSKSSERGALERAAYQVDHSEIHFRGERQHRR